MKYEVSQNKIQLFNKVSLFHNRKLIHYIIARQWLYLEY